MVASPHLEARRFFDEIAEDYTRRSNAEIHNVSAVSFRRRQDLVTPIVLETPRGGTVLDYGMGAAVFGPAATAAGLRYVGIDVSPRMVELARALELPGAEYHVGDLELLDRFAARADTVLAIGLLDYLEDPADGLRRLARCVAPGGRLVASFRHRRSLPFLLREASKRAFRTLGAVRRAGLGDGGDGGDGREGGEGRGGAGESAPSGPPARAFEAPVLENAFVPGRDLSPVLLAEGLVISKVEYLDCSPVFWNMPLPAPVFRAWRRLDAALARPEVAWLCASGVLVARRG